MTKDEAMKLALEALEKSWNPALPSAERESAAKEAITAIREALAQPTSGDYALGYAEGFNDACKRQPEQERYFCQRCGKRVSLTTIHTCTPPREST